MKKLALLFLFLVPTTTVAQRAVLPNDGTWIEQTRNSDGTVSITRRRPHSGNASLDLQVEGNLGDWAWFNLFTNPQGWGSLRNLTYVGFDWLRGADHANQGDAVWAAQTPALRLYVRDGESLSELVWERWYTDQTPTPTNTWTTEDMTNQNFWRFVNGSGYTTSPCTSIPYVPGISLQTATPVLWADCYTNPVVYGIGVGLGSSWPIKYTGFVDNVRLNFSDTTTIYDNFELAKGKKDKDGNDDWDDDDHHDDGDDHHDGEFDDDDPITTPEPATMFLVGSGLLGVVGAARRKK